MYKMLNIRKR